MNGCGICSQNLTTCDECKNSYYATYNLDEYDEYFIASCSNCPTGCY